MKTLPKRTNSMNKMKTDDVYQSVQARRAESFLTSLSDWQSAFSGSHKRTRRLFDKMQKRKQCSTKLEIRYWINEFYAKTWNVLIWDRKKIRGNILASRETHRRIRSWLASSRTWYFLEQIKIKMQTYSRFDWIWRRKLIEIIVKFEMVGKNSVRHEALGSRCATHLS